MDGDKSPRTYVRGLAGWKTSRAHARGTLGRFTEPRSGVEGEAPSYSAKSSTLLRGPAKLDLDSALPLEGATQAPKIETLRDRLTITPLHRTVDSSVRHYRERLCSFLREIERQVFVAAGAKQNKIREMLGWTDEVFHRFIHSPLLSNSSPHASMNLFSPNLAHPWIHRSIQEIQASTACGAPVHVRTMVAHNNLGDSKYKTYAWWHRTVSGRLHKKALFSRNHSVRHKVVLAQAAPQINTEGCVELDKKALALATHATTYAYFCILYRSVIERAAGLHRHNGLLELPLNILNAFTFQTEDLVQWNHHFQSLLATPMRSINSDRELMCLSPDQIAEITPLRLKQLQPFPLIAPNYFNFAQLYLFGITVLTGGRKMAGYVREMHDIIRVFFTKIEKHSDLPQLIPVTSIPIEKIMPLPDEEQNELASQGVVGPLAIGVADHGSLIGQRLNALLDHGYVEFYPEGENHETRN